jgi:hypothetical protein
MVHEEIRIARRVEARRISWRMFTSLLLGIIVSAIIIASIDSPLPQIKLTQRVKGLVTVYTAYLGEDLN